MYAVHQDVAKVFLKIACHLFADSRNKSGAKETSKFAFYSTKGVCVAQAVVNCVKFEAKSDSKVGAIYFEREKAQIMEIHIKSLTQSDPST